ncbi:hypothetical protein HQ560_21390, partial [bacterium]|nr:hypothetical protein [bacterium]
AARLLNVTFEQDGKVVLQTYYDDGGRADGPTVWRYLATEPIMVAKKPMAITPDAKDPKTAALAGAIRVRVQHVRTILAEAAVRRLKLIRKDAAAQKWFLPAGEVERAAKEAGIDKKK